MTNVPRVGVGVIITRGDRVLLMRRANSHGAGTWSAPGGHLDFGESPEECAIREAKEETNLDIGDLIFRGITNDVFQAEGKHYITIWMQGRRAAGEATVNAAYEMTEIGWFPWDALPQPLFLPLQNLLEGKCYPSQETVGAENNVAL